MYHFDRQPKFVGTPSDVNPANMWEYSEAQSPKCFKPPFKSCFTSYHAFIRHLIIMLSCVYLYVFPISCHVRHDHVCLILSYLSTLAVGKLLTEEYDPGVKTLFTLEIGSFVFIQPRFSNL